MNDSDELAAARLRYPPTWVIYDRPRDYHDYYVVRVWYGMHPERKCTLVESLREARDAIERAGGSVLLQPAAKDDPCIVETWL